MVSHRNGSAIVLKVFEVHADAGDVGAAVAVVEKLHACDVILSNLAIFQAQIKPCIDEYRIAEVPV